MDEIYNKLTAVGDAVREKTGASGLLTLDDMANRLNALRVVGGSLTVTSEPTATITVSNGIKSYIKTVDANGSAIFDGLDDGTWTIEGVFEGSTVTEAIIVDTAYSARLKFAAYLYKNGIMYAPLSSGFVDGSRGGIDVENVNNKLKCSGDSTYIQKYDMTTDSIDLNGYNWLYVNVSSCNGSFYIGFDNLYYNPTAASGENALMPMSVGMNIRSPGVYKVSLSGINSESHKIGIGLNYGYNAECYIDEIWVCPDDIYDATEKEQDVFLIGG